jgi:hypothetical protein
LELIADVLPALPRGLGRESDQVGDGPVRSPAVAQEEDLPILWVLERACQPMDDQCGLIVGLGRVESFQQFIRQIPILCEQVRALLEGTDVGLVVCDLAALGGPDAATIDALARLQLTARRLGSGIRLRHACGELRDLLVLTGLDEVVRLDSSLPPEVSGQPEEREPAPSVEEEGDPGDPPV